MDIALSSNQINVIKALYALNQLEKLEKTENKTKFHKKRKIWVNPFLQKRGCFDMEEHLLHDLLWNNGDDYKNFTRMTISSFENILSMVEMTIKKKDTVMRPSISARIRLAITLRFIATGDSYRSLEFLSRVSRKTINIMGTPDENTIKSPLSDLYEESETDLIADRLAKATLSNRSYPKQVTMGRRVSDSAMNAELYMEATGRRRSSDHGVVLTTDTDSFIIGQRVWVGGTRPGHIAYIGETHFAPGEWAGVVLDEPNGKNDGCVSGKRYFQCEPKKGIFSRLTRLTHEPLPGANISSKESSPGRNRSSKTPDRSHTVSPTSSLRLSASKSGGKHGLTVGDRVIVSSGLGSKTGTLKYIGETKFAQGNWCGIQLDEPIGKNNGSIDGVRYFECPPKYGLFVPIAKVSLSPTSKKSRLSRAGSRESLVSNATMNSIATTNTSRLRMSAHGQTLACSTSKPAAVPRSTFSLQDVIREKQNHIEQLIKERELDREDAQNQTIIFQKTISENSSDHGRWTRLIEQRDSHLEDLRREFRGWSGSHEEHCILHDVLGGKQFV